MDILGLPREASEEDIKTAYKEAVQILHPDRFQNNKRLQNRATEQFKTLQEAYRYLTEEEGFAQERKRKASTYYSAADATEAKLAAIRAAKARYLHERDEFVDKRRNAIIVAVIAAVVSVFCARKPGPLMVIAAFSIPVTIGAVTNIITLGRNINKLSEEIDLLRKEEKRIAEESEE